MWHDNKLDEAMIGVANWLDYGKSKEEIRQELRAMGLSEEEAYLSYAAGKILHEHRSKTPKATR